MIDDVTGPEEVQLFFLTAQPEACRQARRAVLAVEELFPSTVRDDVGLLVSELVSNAVRHGKGDPGRTVRVELRQWADRVRVEVFNEGSGFTAEAPFMRDPGDGWGLSIVDGIADRWAIAPTGSGTRAWFEIRMNAEREAPSTEGPALGRILGRFSVLKRATASLMRG